MDQSVNVPTAGESGPLLAALRAIWVGKWQVAAMVLLFVLAASAWVLTREPLYRATASIQIELRQNRVLDMPGLYDSGTGTWGYFNTQVMVISSRELANHALDRLDWQRYRHIFDAVKVAHTSVIEGADGDAEEFRQARIDYFQKGIKIESVPTTQIVRIHYLSPDPVFAQAAANALAEAYFESDYAVQTQLVERASQWISDRLALTQSRLLASENKFQQFRESLGLVGDREAHRELEEALDNYQQRLRNVRQQQTVLFVSRDLVVKAGDDAAALAVIPAIMESEFVRSAKQVLLAAERKSSAEGVITLPEARALYERELRAEADLLQARYALNQRLIDELDQQVKDIRVALRERDRQAARLKLLRREVETNSRLYETMLSRLTEVDIAGDFQPHKARMVDAAVKPRRAHTPQKRRAIVFAAFFGLMAGIALVMLRYYALAARAPCIGGVEKEREG